MASWFIRKGGNDSNAGTSAGAAWLTIQKAHNAAAGPTGGDTVWIGSGTYREVVTANMTSPTSELKFVADVDGAQTGDAGPVIWTAYTTNDTSAPSTSSLLTLNGRDFLTYEGFYMVGGNTTQSVVEASTTVSTNITFRRCLFNSMTGTTVGVKVVGTAGTALTWLVEQCLFVGGGFAGFWINAPRHSADYDLAVTVKNCLFRMYNNGDCFYVDTSGATAGLPGGIVVLNCSLWGGGYAAHFTTNYSTSITSKFYNCVILGQSVGLSANNSGAIVEDFNFLGVANARINVSAGGSSVVAPNRAMLLDYGHAVLTGFLCRLVDMPLLASPFLGFGNQSSPAPPTVDLLNRPRPAGGSSTSNGIGCLERHDTAAKETTTIDSGAASLKITGPGDHDIRVPVNTTTNLIAVRVRYDTNHGTTNKPQAILLDNGEIGLGTGQTLTATVGVDTWETLTFNPFGATIRGAVTIRLVSRSAAGNGIAYFDTFTVPTVDTSGMENFARLEPLSIATSTGSAPPGVRMVAGGSRVPVY